MANIIRHIALSAVVSLQLFIAGPVIAQTVLNRGNGAEPETLDVHKMSGEVESNIAVDLFEGLMTLDRNGKVMAGAAASWDISGDGKTYTFHLRDDAKWSDGSPVTAGDFVFSWQRLVDPLTASPFASFLDGVVNAEVIRNGKMPSSSLGVRASGDKTFIVQLVSPVPYFLGLTAHSSTFPISEVNYKKYGDAFIRPGNMVSNGAYMLQEALPQSHITLVKNPFFHDSKNVAIDKVKFFAIDDQNSEFAQFKAGQLDVSFVVPGQQIEILKKEMGSQLRIFANMTNIFYSFNMTHEPWKSNKDLRRALSLAIDRDVIVQSVLRNYSPPAFTLVVPQTANYFLWQPVEATWTQGARDIEAKRLMQKAGYDGTKPLEVEILYNTNEDSKKLVIAMAAMWQSKLGIKTTLKNEEWAIFLASNREKTYRDITRAGWIADYDDPYSFLSIFLGNAGDVNVSGYQSKEFDDIMKLASAMVDLQGRAALLQKAEKILIDDQPFIPLYYRVRYHLVSEKVKGWQDNIKDLHLTRWLSVD